MRGEERDTWERMRVIIFFHVGECCDPHPQRWMGRSLFSHAEGAGFLISLFLVYYPILMDPTLIKNLSEDIQDHNLIKSEPLISALHFKLSKTP